MSKKVLVAILSLVTIVFLTAQTCSVGTGLAAECAGEGDIVCSDDGEAYQCQLATYGVGFYVTRADDESLDEACATEVEEEEEEEAEDTDGDGLSDEEEALLGTDETVSDTDGDGLTDGYEVNTAGTDPLDKDTDNDTLSDYKELFVTETDPLGEDTDGDGYTDVDEIYVYSTDPTDAAVYPTDTDGDGIEDSSDDDDDDDGVSDSDEDTGLYGYDPTDPLDADTDDDGLTDYEELTGNYEIETSSGVSYTTDPVDADTDDGGVSDGDEVYTYETDPLDGSDDTATTTEAECKQATEAEDCGGYGCKSDGTCFTSCTKLLPASCAEGYACSLMKCVEETTTTTEVAAYEVTDITDASIDKTTYTALSFWSYEALEPIYSSSTVSMGILETDGSYTDMPNNPSAASPLLIGASASYWKGLNAIRIVTVTTDVSTLGIFLPRLAESALTDTYMLFYVAEDGSTYYADADHNGVLPGRSDLLTAEDALTTDDDSDGTPDHLASAAE